MSINLSVIDKRVFDNRCNWDGSPYQIVVDGQSCLSDVLAKIKSKAGQDKIGMLSILAHGYGRKGADGKEYGGFGVEFCKEDITLKTAKDFSVLRELFADTALGIELIGCGAAAQYRFKTAEGRWVVGFGWRLCKLIAASAKTGVKASTELQKVSIGDYYYTRRVHGVPTKVTVKCADAGAWEGQVWIFTPDGKHRKAGTSTRVAK